MKKLKYFAFLYIMLILTSCLGMAPQYQVVHTTETGAIVKNVNFNGTTCEGLLCPAKYRYSVQKNILYYIPNIEGITYYDGYIVEVPDGYELVDSGLYKYTPRYGETLTIQAKAFKKKE